MTLAIAGSDSSGGAGIQADLKAFAALGVYGVSAITALTAQNTTVILGILRVSPDFVGQQIDAVVGDFPIDATKTGMLESQAIVELVAAKVSEHRLRPLVVDPVLAASSGGQLLTPDGLAALRDHLIPLATVVTPNLAEAAILSGRSVHSVADMREAARAIHALGAGAVVITGGHLDGGSEAIDVLFDGSAFLELRAARIDTPHTHGSGCTFAACLAAALALGAPVEQAAARAKEVTTAAIRWGLPLGKGAGPVDVLYEAIHPNPPQPPMRQRLGRRAPP
ncbi:MAG: bifunctional hydroxymethylpyrimidine kinase/phosphomethylpyrimidine kinase [Chloroflexi bacterium]|nr:bifunctional hydroxymethylpyrimidine kinase/phosphomethylpyrimidine kinase [Chloroflexota bacterium]